MDYYNTLARYYKYFYNDWEASVADQAGRLDSVIREFFGEKRTVADVACGMGTQALGLAALGYRVFGSDLSPAALAVAMDEARRRGLDMEFVQADMREVSRAYIGKFDVVLAADNAVPHLLSDEDILKAFREFLALLEPGGGCIISARDYAGVNPGNEKFRLVPRTMHALEDGKLVMFDLWEFDGAYYDMTTYMVRDGGGTAPETVLARARYYRVGLPRLEELMREAGFRQVRTLEKRFFQPLLIGSR